MGIKGWPPRKGKKEGEKGEGWCIGKEWGGKRWKKKGGGKGEGGKGWRKGWGGKG